MDTPNLSKLLAQVTEIVERAGVLLSQEWNRAEGPRGEGDKAVVDVEIENMLRPELLNLLSCDFWGEETVRLLTGHAWCWVVDPNDGTSDFMKGLKGSAISVGLLCESIPVLGVVYAPVTPEGLADCLAAEKNEMAWVYELTRVA
jgi:myo-inositol-1(or 4)-monophosphatase